ncbi:hypothetical protein WNZ14_23385 [Hoeflea sp. AS60]|uniref:hypothetical protein n=1 Tax=Hoeflea sp. AS60 TaxID=3135780 RepID=UPI0031804CCA
MMAGMEDARIRRIPDPADNELQAQQTILASHLAQAQRTKQGQLTFVRCNISFKSQSLTVNALLGRFLPRFHRANSAVFFDPIIKSILLPEPQAAG